MSHAQAVTELITVSERVRGTSRTEENKRRYVPSALPRCGYSGKTGKVQVGLVFDYTILGSEASGQGKESWLLGINFV